MIALSLRALGIGIGLAAVLALAANVVSLPIGVVYVAFVAIVAVTLYVAGTDAGMLDRRPGARAPSRRA